MAVGVIHILEMVEIHPEHCHGSLVTTGSLKLLIQHPGHLPPVQKTGQGIPSGHLLKLCL